MAVGGALILIGAAYAFYLISVGSVMFALHTDGQASVMTATQFLPQGDFARLWFVGRRLLVDRADLLGVHASLPPWWSAVFKIDILSQERDPILVWLYPPTMNLLAMIFATVPLALGFWLWRFASIVLAAALLRRGGLGWPTIVAGVVSPAAIFDAYLGQNGTLTGSLLAGSLLLLDKRPRAGGVVGALLCIKPQVAVVLPAILLRRHRRAALVSCIATVAALVALSLVIEGWRPWSWFFFVGQPTAAQIRATPFEEFFPDAGFTVFMFARSLGASVPQAWMVQATSTVIALALVWRLWRSPATDPIGRMALTMCLSALATTYGYQYDLMGFSLAMAAMFTRAPEWQKPVFGALWLFGGYSSSIADVTGLILAPVVVAIGAACTWRLIRPSGASGERSLAGGARVGDQPAL